MTFMDCPTGCGRQRVRRKLMCTHCWGRVPVLLRRKVTRTWRAVETEGTDQAYEQYDEARNEAIASVVR